MTTYSYDSAGNITATDCLTNISAYWLRPSRPAGEVTATRSATSPSAPSTPTASWSKSPTPPAASAPTPTTTAGNLSTETDALGYPTRYTYTASTQPPGHRPRRQRQSHPLRLRAGRRPRLHHQRRQPRRRTGPTTPRATATVGPTAAARPSRTPTTAWAASSPARYPDGTLHTFNYDAQRQPDQLHRRHSAPPRRSSTPQDRLRRSPIPGSRWLRYTYDAAGRRASMTDQLGHRTDYHYDADGPARIA